MSQVIVTDDALKPLRERSRGQEHKISREDQFAHWRRSDITGKDPFLTVIGFAVLPIVGIWALLGVAAVVMLELANYVFKLLGIWIGGTKSLITGK